MTVDEAGKYFGVPNCHLVHLPVDLDFLQRLWVIILAGSLYLIAFAAR